jgi:hypothetical protein
MNSFPAIAFLLSACVAAATAASPQVDADRMAKPQAAPARDYGIRRGDYYVTLSFGEKSGFDRAFTFYHVKKELAVAGMHLRKAPKVGYYVGPCGNKWDAQLFYDKVESLAQEHGWMHFYVNIERAGEGRVPPLPH